MKVVSIGAPPPKGPKPHPEIVLLLTAAESGELQDIACVWLIGDEIRETAYTTENELSLGAVTYSLAHHLMTGYFGDE